MNSFFDIRNFTSLPAFTAFPTIGKGTRAQQQLIPCSVFGYLRTTRNERSATLGRLRHLCTGNRDELMYRWETCGTVTPPSADCESSNFFFVEFGRTMMGTLLTRLDDLCY